MGNKHSDSKKALIKMNGGIGAVLCSECGTIIRAGSSMTEEDWAAARGEIHLPPQYCNKHNKTNKNETQS